MKTTITLTLSKECIILCDIFRFAMEDLLLSYMKQVAANEETAETKEELNSAGLFFMSTI
jgi:hypothetical protein